MDGRWKGEKGKHLGKLDMDGGKSWFLVVQYHIAYLCSVCVCVLSTWFTLLFYFSWVKSITDLRAKSTSEICQNISSCVEELIVGIWLKPQPQQNTIFHLFITLYVGYIHIVCRHWGSKAPLLNYIFILGYPEYKVYSLLTSN